MYAVIATGGKQYKVEEGNVLRFEKLDGEVGADVTFDHVLLVGIEGEPRIGTPHVQGVTVAGKITAQDRARKIMVYKKKRRKGFEKRYGHRQPYTEVKIVKINT